MNPLRVLFVVALTAAAVLASPTSDMANGSLKPSKWLRASELQELPSLDEITLQKLENMPLEKGSNLLQKLYSLAQINHDVSPSFVPSPSNVPVEIYMPNREKQATNLNTWVNEIKKAAKEGLDEVTVFITGLPDSQESVKRAKNQLIENYQQRYSEQANSNSNNNNRQNGGRYQHNGNENNYLNTQKPVLGLLVVVDLGNTITNYMRYAMLDVEETGKMLAKTFVQLTNEANVPNDIVHVVAQGIAAQVAGAAGKEYIRQTGNQLRRITALDPSKLLARNPNQMTGLSRGDADLVDAIHTSPYAMGTLARVGDVDFFPNGPSAEVRGAQNVIDAHLLATKYYAESVMPGNERNFPAVRATTIKQYKNNNGFGKRIYMGIYTDFDSQGDYMLEVNESRPYGMRAPAQKQRSYHAGHKHSSSQDYE